MTDLYTDRLPSQIGTLFIAATDTALCAVVFPEGEAKIRAKLEKQLGAVRWREMRDPLGATTRLSAYFQGELDALTSLPVAALGTPFQHLVWNELRRIPIGATTSYGAIAQRIGSPTASRAVGMANGRNPVSIVVPCHRVIGANATLTGYAGGLDRKEWLLAHERKHESILTLRVPK